MLIIGIIPGFRSSGISVLAAIRVGSLCTPFVGLSAGLAAYHSGSGPIGAIFVGMVAGALTLFLGQVALATARLPPFRGTIALLFAAPQRWRAITPHLPCTRCDTRGGMARCNSSCRRHHCGVENLPTHGAFLPRPIGQGVPTGLTSSGLLSSQTRER
jgi:hypothetical protein